jgi:hypothetical protein
MSTRPHGPACVQCQGQQRHFEGVTVAVCEPSCLGMLEPLRYYRSDAAFGNGFARVGGEPSLSASYRIWGVALPVREVGRVP